MPDEIVLDEIPSEQDDRDSGPSRYTISTNPADYPLRVLHELWRQGDIEIPSFQRKYVWTIKQASKLIESFLLGLPVPEIFLYREQTSQKYLVIDGNQRLRSVFCFFEGLYAETRVFRLVDLRTEWQGMRFQDLQEPDRRRLEGAILRAIVVTQHDPKDDSSIYHIFERLNTLGTALSPQEVRSCLNQGRFNEALKNLNVHDEWRKILGSAKEDPRQRDIELMLRFFALYHEHASYEKPMKEFLSKFMQRHRNPAVQWVTDESERFKKVCKFVTNHFSSRPFHIRAGLNAAAFDAVFVAVARHMEAAAPSDLRQRYERLKEDEEFQRRTRDATTDNDTVKKRLELAEKFLFG